MRFQTSAQLGPFLELVILVLEDSRGTSWFVSATKREPYRTVRAHICVLPSPCSATRNLSFLRFHRRRHRVVSTRCFTGLVWVGVKIPQDGNRANRYGHVAVVHGHVCRTLCSVCATGARVAQPVPCNS